MKEKKRYKHIDRVERREISFLLKKGYGVRRVAGVLGRSPSSISEELRHNSVKDQYVPERASQKAYVRRKYSKYQGMKIVGRPHLRDYVENNSKEGWSPEQISGRLRKIDKHLPYASHRAIYKFIRSPYGRLLGECLRYRKKRRQSLSSVAKLEDRVFIGERPKIVESKGRFGDWEGDFIVSGKQGKGVLLVLHERKARYIIVRRIISPTIELVHQIMLGMTGGIVMMETLTLDNDIIFKKHKLLSELLGIPLYFCHPYHSWEKGGVENTNKLIREYVPKGSDISQYSDEYIQMIEAKLNNRPRKCLGYKTPLEVMEENHQLKAKITVDDMLKEGKNKKAPVFGLRV